MEEWPQWSVGEGKEKDKKAEDDAQIIAEKLKEAQRIQKEELDRISKILDEMDMYSRGMSRPIRRANLSRIELQAPKKSFAQGVVDKIKGWFK